METSCLEMLFRSINRLPAKPAIVCGDRSLTYAEFGDLALRMALAMRSRGLGPGKIVPILLPRGPETLAAIMAAWQAGAAPCVLSPEYPAERVADICAQCCAPGALDSIWLEGIPAPGADLGGFQAHSPTADEIGLVVFTSGSTGRPKGVTLPHRVLARNALANLSNLREDDRWLSLAAQSFIAVTLDGLAPLFAGATLYIARDEARKDVARIAAYTKEHDITCSFLPPQMAAAFLQLADGQLRLMAVGSERVRNLYSAKTKILNVYGASETAALVTMFTIDKSYENTPIGKPIAGARIYLLDDDLRPVAEGEIGEICISGQIATGYINLPEETAAKFVANPFSEGTHDKILYHTNDLGRRLPDGNLEYVQRKDWMLKVRGFRVEPGEIEAAMLRSAPLDKAVVVGFENRLGQTLLHACYTAKENIPPSVLLKGMAKTLPDYMLPSFIEQLPSLPLNLNGKVDRTRIKPPDAERLRSEYQPPETLAERALCDAFGRILGFDQVGLDDDFAALGGDSMSAVRIQLLLPPELAVSAAEIVAGRTPRAIAAEAGKGTLLPKVAAREEWPLTLAERQMATEQTMDPGSVAYNVNIAFTLNGALDANRLEGAARELLRRHRVLRSYYPSRSGEFVRRLAEVPSQVMRRENAALDEVANCIKRGNTAFDLARAPLYRFTLFRTGDNQHVLHLCAHHIIIDGMTDELLFAELWKLYQDESAGAPAAAAPDYLDYAVWQNEHGDTSASVAFFLEMFAGGPPDNDMPTHPTRPDTLPHADKTVRKSIDLTALEKVARQLGLTPYSILVAALGMTLAKYSASEDVSLGLAMNGRHLPETAAMYGMFVNTLPLRLKPEGALPLRQYLADTARLVAKVQANQACPFERLVPLLAPDRNPSRAPVFDVMVNYLDEMPAEEFSGLSVGAFPLDTQALAYDLVLEMRHREGVVEAALSYSDRLYDETIVQGMLEQFASIVGRVADNPDQSLMDAGEVSERDARLLSGGFEHDKMPGWPKGRTVVHAFREAAKALPNNRAAVFLDESLSYAELDCLTDNLACAIRKHGVGIGDTVGTLVRRGLMMPVGALGVLKAGAAYVPLDPSYPPERLEYMLKDSRAGLLILDAELEPLVPSYSGKTISAADVMAMPRTGAVAGPVPEAPTPGDLLVLLYTSGTTGQPKGVMIGHANLANFCAWYAKFYRLSPTDAVAAYASFGFDACLMDMFPALSHGACICVVPEEMRLDLPGLNRYFQDHRVTLAFMTTQLGRQFAETMENPHLRCLSTGGESLVPIEPPRGFDFYNLYGPTECTILTTAFRVDRLYDRVPLGKTLANTRVYIIDRHGRMAPLGAPGELCVAGRQVAMGYLNQPELTAAKFTPNPFSSEPDYSRIYHTGDVARLLPDGNLDFIGRRDFQVKIRGFRVELTEIEGRIRQHPAVADAAVLAMDAPAGGKCAVAYVVPADPAAGVNIADLNNFIEEHLPPYMVPAATTVVERIPLNPNGKVDRRKLPPPDFTASVGGAEGETEEAARPRTEFERVIGETVESVLGHSQFGLSTNLLRAGLTSLSAIKLAARLDDTLGLAPPVKEMLREPSVLGIENSIMKMLLTRRTRPEAATAEAPAAADRSQPQPLTQNQAGVCFDCMKRPDTLAYNIPIRLTLPPELPAKRFAAAVAKVIDAHPGLKARLAMDGEVLTQAYSDAPAAVPSLTMSDAELETAAAEFVQPFALFGGPLYRASVIASPSATTLLLDVHHVVFDGGSLDLFLRDLASVYDDGGIPANHAEKLSAFDWAALEAKREGSPEWLDDKAWFDDLLAGSEGASEIAPDLPPRGGMGAMAEVVREANGPAVERFCREYGLTPAGLFLAAVSYTVSRWVYSPDVSFAAIGSGREDLRLRNTMGMFVRTVPLRVNLGEGLTALKFAQAAQKVMTEAMEHSGYPFTRVAAEHGFEPSIMYACELGVTSDRTIGGAKPALSPLSAAEPKFKLSVHIEERDGKPVFAVQYDDARYSRWLMERFADTLGLALDNLMAHPEAPARGISLMSPEQSRLLASFNQNDGPIPEPILHRMFEEMVRRLPDRIALIAAEGEYTFSQLNAEANRLAHALIEHGVQPEERVGFILRRTGRVLVAMLGILKAGCAYIPIDPEYPSERIEHVLEDSGARFLITLYSDTDTAEKLAGRNGVLDIDELRQGQSVDNPNLPVDPRNLAYIIYTSGSTGKPKGVMIEHRGIANYCTAHPKNQHVHALAHDAKAMLSICTVAFDMFLKESFTALCGGITLVFADDVQARDPLAMAELFVRTGADAFNATPSRMLEYAGYPEFLAAIRNCRVLMAGAEKYPESLLAKLHEGRLTARLFNTYGPTEISVSCNCKELTGSTRVTIGQPLLNVHEYVVDQDGNLLPSGMAGELLVGGADVARGYNNLPEQTAERFIRFQGERVYRTGDLGRWTRDGEIHLLGRNDNQVKLRGLRIELGEIENAMAAVAGITACAALIRNLNGQDHICAWYVADSNLEPLAVREALAKSLPQYMLPTAWKRIAGIPKLPNGKDDRRALPEPEIVRLAAHEEPRNELERQFAEVFSSVLGLDRVGALDSFFDIGGTSLAVTRVIIEAKGRGLGSGGGANLAFADIFANPTPRQLADLITARQGGGGKTESPSVEEQYDYQPIHDLLAEGTLEAYRTGPERPLGNVLLTGATGFLGAHVLQALLERSDGKVYCLVRRGTYASAEERLRQMLFYYFEDAYETLFGHRLFSVEGDVTGSPALAGLGHASGRDIDTIINCAANVSHFAKDSSIGDVNLGGVQNLIAFALQERASLVQISTTSVAGFSVDGKPRAGTRLNEQTLHLGQSLENQYAMSKFLAERAILEAAATRGLDAKIMRVGNLMARSRDGEFQINLRSNSFVGRLRAFHAVGSFPYSAYLHQVELAPIDSTARAVLLLAGSPEPCRVFHPFNNHAIYLGDIIEAMRQEGFALELAEDDAFSAALAEATRDPSRSEKLVSMIAYQDMAKGRTAVPIPADCDYTAQALLRRGWQWPKTGDDYLRGFIRGIADLGFFE